MSIHDIQLAVCAGFGVTRLDLLSRRNGQGAALSRQVGMWLSRHATPASLPQIGREFGNRDHTTVAYALRRIDALMAADAAFAETVWAMLKAVNHGESVNRRRIALRAVA